MKFQQIKKLCKAADGCMIYEDGPATWLGTKDAAYPVEDIDISASSVKTLFDWPDVESEIGVSEMPFEHSGLMPEGVSRADVAINRWVKLSQGMTVHVGGDRVCPLIHEGGAMFAQWEKIRPAIRRGEYLDFRLACNRQGEPLIIITNGLMVTGVVRPMTMREAELILEMMKKMACMRPEGTPGDVKQRTQEESADAIGGQISIDETLEEAEKETAEKG